MFRTVLVANRGEIAVRVMKACRELGIASVAVYSDADARALHVLSADEAVRIGPPPAPESYLNIPALIEAARRSGAQAVHPGYGFLSENPEFAEACLDTGLVWIGPPPAAMRAMASKIHAKRLAADLGVPLLVGYQGDDQDPRTLIAEAARIGYPLLIKASAGGGGRGMRVVDDPADFTEALDGARREARGAFGDDRVLLERYARRPRHVEIQVFGDAHGNVIHLGERECSVQRRHQKVIEESPSPALTPPLREQMGAAAVRLAHAIGYTGAGTVEFILTDGAGEGEAVFAFLEMNTRLQVEHGVTELVTGLDLVHLQLRVAAGEPLPITQDGVRMRGHAIQCRIYAEDPANRYLPSSGRLTRFAPPTGKGVRNDIGVYEGDSVSSYYDPMLAKLLVWAEDRQAAIARAAEALDRYEVEGVTTNLPLLRAAVRHPEFAAGRTHTSFLDEHVLPALASDAVAHEALLGAAAFDLLAPLAATSGPWAAGTWRQAGAGVRLTYRYNGVEHTVDADRRPDGAWDLVVNGSPCRVALELAAPGRLLVREEQAVHAYTVEERDGSLRVTYRGRTVALARPGPLSIAATGHAGPGSGGPRALIAPLAGVVVKVSVAEGDAVRARQPLLVLEAMKMEHTIEAPADGIVGRLHRTVGDRVQSGDVLIELQPEPQEVTDERL
jgi:3-methylcrotonyl-CoA carboxylase alpha subunit